MANTFQDINPLRDPAWRFRRVLSLVEREPPGRCSRKDDEFIRAYRRFIARFRSAEDDESRVALFGEDPEQQGLFAAHLYQHQPDREFRWLLQARILTGESDEGIAKRMPTIPESVAWYERLFFNVRDRLECQDYIVRQVIGRPEDRVAGRDGRLTEFQEQITYKLFGYFGGPLVLDVMFGGVVHEPAPDRVARIDQWISTAIQRNLRRKTLSASRHLDVNKYNIMQLLEIHQRLVEAEKDAGGSVGEFERNVSAVLDGIPWKLAEVRADEQQKDLDEGSIDVEATSVEPRVSELLHIASGRVPRKLLKDRRLQIVPSEIAEEEEAK